MKKNKNMPFVSSREPLGSHGELIVYPCCSVHPSSSSVHNFRSNWVTCTFKWGKLLQSHLMEENLQQRTILTE